MNDWQFELQYSPLLDNPKTKKRWQRFLDQTNQKLETFLLNAEDTDPFLGNIYFPDTRNQYSHINSCYERLTQRFDGKCSFRHYIICLYTSSLFYIMNDPTLSKLRTYPEDEADNELKQAYWFFVFCEKTQYQEAQKRLAEFYPDLSDTKRQKLVRVYAQQTLKFIDSNLSMVQDWAEKDLETSCKYWLMASQIAQYTDITEENFLQLTLPLKNSDDPNQADLYLGFLLQLTTIQLEKDITNYRVTRYPDQIIGSSDLKKLRRQIQRQKTEIAQLNKKRTQDQESYQKELDRITKLYHDAQAQLQDKEMHQVAAVRKDLKAQLNASKEKEQKLQRELLELKARQTKPSGPAMSVPKTSSIPLATLAAPNKPKPPVQIDHSLRYAFIIDGDGPVLPRIKERYPNCQILTTRGKEKPVSADTITAAIFVIRFIKHGACYKYKDPCIQAGIPVIFWNDTNLDALDQLIAEKVPEAVIKTPEQAS